jgi:TPR repeat protein
MIAASIGPTGGESAAEGFVPVARGKRGVRDMARFEMADIDTAALGQAPAGADAFYELGMMYSIGRSVPTDLVMAHKWFNLAAMKGNQDAIRLRQEVAATMSPAEIAQAQRAARAFLTTH